MCYSFKLLIINKMIDHGWPAQKIKQFPVVSQVKHVISAWCSRGCLFYEFPYNNSRLDLVSTAEMATRSRFSPPFPTVNSRSLKLPQVDLLASVVWSPAGKHHIGLPISFLWPHWTWVLGKKTLLGFTNGLCVSRTIYGSVLDDLE